MSQAWGRGRIRRPGLLASGLVPPTSARGEMRPRRDAVPSGGVILLAAGGYRTGSTFSYNIVAEFCELGNSGRRIGYLEPVQIGRLESLWSVVDAMGYAVAKSHQAPGSEAGAEAWEHLLADHKVRVFCTVRDLRDVLYSFCCKYELSPADALTSRFWRVGVASMAWWLGHGAIRVEYDDLVADKDGRTRQLLSELGLEPDHAMAEEARNRATTSAAVIPDTLNEGEVCPRTLLHPHHLVRPGGGGWRSWEPGCLDKLRQALEPEMTLLGQHWPTPDS
jgi:hypothetical protein